MSGFRATMRPMTSDRLNQGFALACQLHAGQKKKGSNTAYLGHLLGVASIVIEFGGDEDQVIAALLHDAVEDQGGMETLETIQKEFGNRVATIVLACSDTAESPKPPWKGRKEAYLSHLADASADVLLVSAADKLYNARSIIQDYHLVGDDVWERFNGGKEGTVWYFRSLAETFQRIAPAPIAAEVGRVVRELEAL